VHEFENEALGRIAAMNAEIARATIDAKLLPLRERYRQADHLQSYFDQVADDIVENLPQFVEAGETDHAGAAIMGAVRDDMFRRYTVNTIVCNQPDDHAPVVEETNPTLVNLLGRIEHQMQFGVMTTDFTRVGAGSVHRANGGYLVLNAEDLLSRPLAWPALKRVLRTREVQPTEATTEVGLFSPETLQPEPIALNCKVILIGEPRTYYLLRALDTEFAELFRVKADFRPYIERTPDSERGYAAFIARECRDHSLPPLDASAVARTIEEGSRLADDQRRLTTRLGDIADLVRESAHCAGIAGRMTVTASDVELAIHQRERRNEQPRREILELIRRGVLRFEPEGTAAGKLYGIGLISLGEAAFGRPIHVMASAFLGTAGVIDIEREASMSGPIHNKGFLVLSGYLGRQFARNEPLILSASVSFDQLYEEVEGDSASAAELYALMSAIGNVPLRQGMAVTGAVNPEGSVLPVGGVTRKIEGFFDACLQVGLTGDQGVIIPRGNIENLLLRRDVREAIENGRFHIHAIDRIEQGWPVLAGMAAGETTADGSYTENTVHDRVAQQLEAWAEQWKSFGAPAGGEPLRHGVSAR
jgi:lon-related putative ATP-dependent protease